jgi:hypothetical protein
MPHKRTVKRWLAEKPTLQERYAQAKEEMAEHFAEEILEIADDGSNDWIERKIESGKIIKVVDHEHIARSRLRVDTRKWLISKSIETVVKELAKLGFADVGTPTPAVKHGALVSLGKHLGMFIDRHILEGSIEHRVSLIPARKGSLDWQSF